MSLPISSTELNPEIPEHVLQFLQLVLLALVDANGCLGMMPVLQSIFFSQFFLSSSKDGFGDWAGRMPGIFFVLQ